MRCITLCAITLCSDRFHCVIGILMVAVLIAGIYVLLAMRALGSLVRNRSCFTLQAANVLNSAQSQARLGLSRWR